jgi:hypothetical protein
VGEKADMFALFVWPFIGCAVRIELIHVLCGALKEALQDFSHVLAPDVALELGKLCGR